MPSLWGVLRLQKKHSQYWRTVRDINLDRPVTFRVHIIRVRCPSCAKPFPLPPPIPLVAHARTTPRSKDAALSLVVQTNASLEASSTVTRDLTHLRVPRATLHRWKQSAVSHIPEKAIIDQLGFSGILCLDECRAKRTDVFNLFATDRLKGRILFLDETEDRHAICGACAERFCTQLQGFGVKPWVIIADMAGGIMKGARTVFPDALYQIDYFHVMKSVHEKLRAEIRRFWWQLQQKGHGKEAALLWDAQWTLLRNGERWDERDEERWNAVCHHFPGTIIARLPAFKQELRDVFDKSANAAEAFRRRDAWIAHWHSSLTTTTHLRKIITLMTSVYFPHMITYLDHPTLPRTTNAETLIRTYRKMEKARYGFGSLLGRQNHLKLYQLKTYLAQKVG